MSCYIRHLIDVMDALSLKNTRENRKRLDSAIREELGMSNNVHCPEVWAKLKPILTDNVNKAQLVDGLRAKIS